MEIAGTLVGGVDAALEIVGVPIFPFDRINRDFAERTVRSTLGDERYVELYNAGRALTVEESSALAATVRPPSSDRRFDPTYRLTSRETEVLSLIANGLTDQAIANHLYISRRTVNSHVAHILTKLNVQTRLEAVNIAKILERNNQQLN